MEIQPGAGTALVRLGESRVDVEARIGKSDSRHGERAHYTGLTPALVLDYDSAGNVELIEIPYAGIPEHEVTLNGTRLTYRPLDDVLADLRASGYSGRRSDIGYDFADGFAIWSMGSLSLSDLDPSVEPDDERDLVEGVSIASPEYFGF